MQKSAERGCLENCRRLLQTQVDAASGEIVAARAEIDRAKQSLEVDLQAARSALATIKAPESATPLADRLGVSAWVIDSPPLGIGLYRGKRACLPAADVRRTPSRPGACIR